MEHSTFVILEIISIISVIIGLIAFTVAKTIENKHDLDDIYNKSVSWLSALVYTFAPVWITILALLIMTVLMFAVCGVYDFITYMTSY